MNKSNYFKKEDVRNDDMIDVDKIFGKDFDGTVCEYTICENCGETMENHIDVNEDGESYLKCPGQDNKFVKKKEV
jgi:hypothetical protein